jgi:hypothetical protein
MLILPRRLEAQSFRESLKSFRLKVKVGLGKLV